MGDNLDVGSSISFHLRLTKYASMVLAAAAALTPSAADAAVIVHDVDDVTTDVNGFLYFSLVSGATSASQLADSDFYFQNLFAGNSGASSATSGSRARAAYFFGLDPTRNFVTSAGYAARLGSQMPIGTGATFNYFSNELAFSFGGFQLGNWNGGAKGFVGLSFLLGGETHYGWAELAVDALNYQVTLYRFAYESTPGASIVTPEPVPEPASISLMALGAVGLALYRKRKSAGGQPA